MIIANVCGSAVAGGLVSLTGCKFYGGIGSPLEPLLVTLNNQFRSSLGFSVYVWELRSPLSLSDLREAMPLLKRLKR